MQKYTTACNSAQFENSSQAQSKDLNASQLETRTTTLSAATTTTTTTSSSSTLEENHPHYVKSAASNEISYTNTSPCSTLEYKQDEVRMMAIPTIPYYPNTASLESPLISHAETANTIAQMRNTQRAYPIPTPISAHAGYNNSYGTATYLQRNLYDSYPVSINNGLTDSFVNGSHGNGDGYNQYQQQQQQQQQVMPPHQQNQASFNPYPIANVADDLNGSKEDVDTNSRTKPDLEYVGALALMGMRKQSLILPSPPVSGNQSPVGSPETASPIRTSAQNSLIMNTPSSPASPMFTHNNTVDYNINNCSGLSSSSTQLKPSMQSLHSHHDQTFSTSSNMCRRSNNKVDQDNHMELGYDPYHQQWVRQGVPHTSSPRFNDGNSMPRSPNNASPPNDISTASPHQQLALLQSNPTQAPQLSTEPEPVQQQSIKKEQPRAESSAKKNTSTNLKRPMAPSEIDISNIEFDPEVNEPIILGNVMGRRRGVAGSHGGGNIFTCDHPGCGKVFRRLYNLKSHMSCHMGDRPFACEECHVTFKRIADLRRHIRCLHSSIRPFQCPTCHAGFARSDVFHHHVEFCRNPANSSAPVYVKRTGRGGSRVSLNGVVSPAIVASGVSGIGPTSVYKYTNAFGVNPLQAAANSVHKFAGAFEAAAQVSSNQVPWEHGNHAANNVNYVKRNKTGSMDNNSNGYSGQQSQPPKQSTASLVYGVSVRETRKKRVDYSKYDLSDDEFEEGESKEQEEDEDKEKHEQVKEGLEEVDEEEYRDDADGNDEE